MNTGVLELTDFKKTNADFRAVDLPKSGREISNACAFRLSTFFCLLFKTSHSVILTFMIVAKDLM